MIKPDDMGDIRLRIRSSTTTGQAKQEGMPWKENLPMEHNPSHAEIISDAACPAGLSLELTPIAVFTANLTKEVEAGCPALH